MNEQRLRQLYGRGIAGRDARSELAGACAVAPERLLALVRRELPEDETLELLDEVMSSSACREAFELLRVVDAAGREIGADAAAAGVAAPADASSGPAPASPMLLAGPTPESPARPPAVPPSRRAATAPRPWWRRHGASMALAASAILAVGLFTRDRGAGVEPTRGADAGVALIAPATRMAAGSADAASFVWHAVPGATRYEFELSRADGEPLHQATTSDTSVALPADVALQAGVEYRWLVRAVTPGGQRSSPARALLISAR